MRSTYQPVYEKLVHMRRRFRPQVRRTHGFVDSAPMVDVTLLFILFFVIQSSFVVQPGIRVHLPPADFTDGAAYGSMVVTMSQEGLVFFNDERVELEALASFFTESMTGASPGSLLIEADAGVAYESLVRIYSMAREAGIEEVVLATGVRPVQE